MNVPLDVLKVASLAAAGWAVDLALGRRPASARHDVWLLVVVGAVLVPATEVLLPPLYVTLPGPLETIDHVSAGWLPLALGVWAAGALLWTARVVPGLLALRRIARRGEPWSSPEAAAALSHAARLAGVTRPVMLLRSAEVEVPATWGVRRPVVALPAAATEWTPERLRLVLLHELVHVRRQDVVVEAFLRIAGALYWFHPALWLASRRLRLERERACDEAVLASGARASDYCEHLVEIMRAATRHARSDGAVVGATMAAPCTLEHRVRAMLEVPLARPGAPGASPRLGRSLVLAGAVAIYALGVLSTCPESPPMVIHHAAAAGR